MGEEKREDVMLTLHEYIDVLASLLRVLRTTLRAFHKFVRGPICSYSLFIILYYEWRSILCLQNQNLTKIQCLVRALFSLLI